MFEKGYTPWNKGIKFSKKRCKEMSETAKGLNTWSKGRKLSESHRKNILAAIKYGKDNPCWKGGKTIHKATGYVLVKCHKHPFKNKNSYVFEHRLVMEKSIGRLLNPAERVHHINGNKVDNRIENLILFPNQSEHQKFHHS